MTFRIMGMLLTAAITASLAQKPHPLPALSYEPAAVNARLGRTLVALGVSPMGLPTSEMAANTTLLPCIREGVGCFIGSGFFLNDSGNVVTASHEREISTLFSSV